MTRTPSEVIASFLRVSGATVHTARSAAEAFAVLMAWPPDALLSDLEMPEEDGCELIARVRELAGPLRYLPAIAISGHHQTMDRVHAHAAGFDSFMPKPFDPAALVTTLKSLWV